MRITAAAVEPVQGREQRLDPRIGDAVPERLGFAAEGNDPLLAHAREMLRQRRLGQADFVGERADRRLARFHQLAKDEQPAVVGEGREDVGHLGGVCLEGREIGWCFGHFVSFLSGIANFRCRSECPLSMTKPHLSL